MGRRERGVQADRSGGPVDSQPVNGLEPPIIEFLERSGLVAAGESPDVDRLPGGVSSDIWVVRTRHGRAFCLEGTPATARRGRVACRSSAELDRSRVARPRGPRESRRRPQDSRE